MSLISLESTFCFYCRRPLTRDLDLKEGFHLECKQLIDKFKPDILGIEKRYGDNPTTRRLVRVYGNNWFKQLFNKSAWLSRAEFWLFEF